MDMTKQLEIGTLEEVEKTIHALALSAEETRKALASLAAENDGIQFLSEMKFSEIGKDPLNRNRALNVVEQVNQTFTYLASFKAVEYLLKLHPEGAPYVLNLGTASGSDIESKNKQYLAAEVFAAVNPTNNNKLTKDIEKVSKAEAKFRFVFFMCPGIDKGRQQGRPEYPGVEVYSLGQ